jgi:diguanylate cyclase (GGDEF)-like protein
VSSVLSWEKATAALFDVIGLRTIQRKIIAFSLIATLIPSVTMGWLSYRNNRRVLDEKISQELNNLTSSASRELDLWITEHRYQARVLSSSYEVSENLAEITDPETSARTRTQAQKHLEDYLGSIDERFTDYEELVAWDATGTVVAGSREPAGMIHLPEDWLDLVHDGETVIGEAYRDDDVDADVMIIAESIRDGEDAFLGAWGAKITFDPVTEILAAIVADTSRELYVMTRDGRVLASSSGASPVRRSLDAASVRELFTHEMESVDFLSADRVEVLGTVQTVPALDWGVVAQRDREQSYKAVARVRNLTLVLIATVLLCIGIAAYLFCLTIVRPLNRISGGASAVAEGDFDIDLPVYGRSEISHMTGAFNEMVERLREYRDENASIHRKLRHRNEALHERSITDGLTGLYNRSHMPDMLTKQLARARRYGHAFSLLMIDIDHFKRYNDTHGHQTGDDALVDVAQVLRDSTRSCDYATRYGGEEFLVVLTATERSGAAEFAERIRSRVEEMRSKGRSAVTISIGVASYPENGTDIEAIIRAADAALYACKRNGRNRVELADVLNEKKSKTKKRKKPKRASG